MSQYRIDEKDCPHPDFALGFHYNYSYGTRVLSDPYMYCGECDWKMPVQDAEDFVRQREAKYLLDEGKDASIKRDMFGNEISVGSMVVYPTLSGRSATLSYGQVVEINPKTTSSDGWSEWARRPRADAPDRLKVLPMPYTTRWKSWRAGRDGSKPVTLSVNAVSAVVIK